MPDCARRGVPLIASRCCGYAQRESYDYQSEDCPGGEATPRSGAATTQHLLTAEHIEGLPRDIRGDAFARARACCNKVAAPYFSVSIQTGGTRFVSLPFEGFVCMNQAAVWNDGLCPAWLYLGLRGRQRLVFDTRARELRMFNDGNTVGFEVIGGSSGGNYRWQATGSSGQPSLGRNEGQDATRARSHQRQSSTRSIRSSGSNLCRLSSTSTSPACVI